MLQINGKALSLPKSISLADYLRQEGYQLTLIAVEYNGAILPKGNYETTLLSDGDTLEIVNFVGGG